MFFTAEQRDRTRDRILELARGDGRLVAGALVGSTAEGGDRWSDLDITFGTTEEAEMGRVLADWTEKMRREFDAAVLFDLPHRSTVYRVFMLPGELQVDLSFTPGADFGATSPRFKLVWGKASKEEHNPAPTAQAEFGMSVHHLVRARICVERGRLWQAEYWVDEARHHALTLACVNRGARATNGRGFDDLPSAVLDRFSPTLVGSADGEVLLRAVGAASAALLEEAKGLEIPEWLRAQLKSLGEG